jgi:hypothetical protein
MSFTDVLYTVYSLDLPWDFQGNLNDFQRCGMAIGINAKVLYDLHKFGIVPGNHPAALVQTWLIGRRRLRPIRSPIHFFERLGLSELSQPSKRLVTDGKLSEARIDDNRSHGRSFLSFLTEVQSAYRFRSDLDDASQMTLLTSHHLTPSPKNSWAPRELRTSIGV